ncbi:MAG: DNA repair protein RecN [Bacteroidales bacterium]|nr:DNA repair protein RecN [Bacteroidales bacterium]
MLGSLQIRNYVLIDSLDVSFPEGLVIITGQTGAGKSIILGALSMLLGSKADASVIGPKGDNCVVEAEFVVPSGDSLTIGILEENEIDPDGGRILMRRVVSRSGRSRSFINDCPVNLQVLQAVSSRLLDIHSQHQTLLLSDRAFQLGMLDHFCGNVGLLEEAASCFSTLRSLQKELLELSSSLERIEADSEYIRSRWKRLDDAGLREGELEELEAEQKQLANAETIKENLYEVEEALGGLDLKEVRKKLEKAGKYLPEAMALAERLESSRMEIKDILEEAASINSRTELSQSRLEAVESRMGLLYDLLGKYSVSTVGELIAERERLSGELTGSDSLALRKEELSHQVASKSKEMEGICRRLHEARISSCEDFAESVSADLRSLELERAVFEVSVEDAPLSASGTDAVRFLFSANGDRPVDVAKCASGGELSRLMLSLKAMMGRFMNMPTLIFDEIDSGVSGSAADKMGQMICSMGRDMQIFAITHLPQVAAKGDAHYLVEKGIDTEGVAATTIRPVQGEERVMEIARMLSGSRISAAAVENAKALLSI